MPFHLDTAIATWRKALQHRKGLLGEDLDELEQHLRDAVRDALIHGEDEEAAYRAAIRRMGDVHAVEAAYRRVYWGKLKRKGLLKTNVLGEIAMLRNYLTIALRNLKRYPGYTFINVFGLAAGLACCLLIALFVRDEIAYDRFHEHADRIVRVTLQVPDREIEVTPTVVAPLFKRTFPEVAQATRVYDISRFRKTTIQHGGQAWQEDRFMYADSTVFDVFTFPFLAGDPATALTRPNTLVLTERTARKYFGEVATAYGQALTVGASTFEVTGVIENIPANSHLQFDLLGAFASTHWAGGERWDSANFYTYLRLTNADALPALAAKKAALLDETRTDLNLPDGFDLGLQRLTDIYLVHMGREKYVWLFTALAALILLIACINYMNLATARSARRAREVGMRKALGAHRAQVARQFLGESALLVALAMALGLALAAALVGPFNALTDKALSLSVLATPWMLAALTGGLLLIALGAGAYPAFVLSRFRPATVLKGTQRSGTGSRMLRQGLVVFQFAVTFFLLVATAVVYNQLRFIQSKDVGFDREHVVIIPLAAAEAQDGLPAFRRQLAQSPRVQHVSAVNAIPGAQRGGYLLFRPGDPENVDRPRVAASPVDPYALDALGLDLLAGSGFRDTPEALQPTAGRYQYVVNEALVRTAGWTLDTAVGQPMSVSGEGRMGEVVGVVRDYHYLPLHETIEPMALFVEPSWNQVLVKIDGTDVAGTVNHIRTTWAHTTGGSPFTYAFLDDEFAAFYERERRLGQLFGGAALLAVLIACLGLFGLASFTAERRTKEIGVRKVLGASVPSLVGMLGRDFARLVLVGFVLAVPVAWWAMRQWLDGFAFRTPLAWWLFAGAGLLALTIAWLTVSYQSYRAATTDPVQALRYE